MSGKHKYPPCKNCGCTEINTDCSCSDCGEIITICPACGTILKGCECGNCDAGMEFIEGEQ